MTDYKCINGHDKCNEMNASETCPYCVPVVVNPKPWNIESGSSWLSTGAVLMIRDAEGDMVCLNDGYDQQGPRADTMEEIVKAVNYHEELIDTLKELSICTDQASLDRANVLLDKIAEEENT